MKLERDNRTRCLRPLKRESGSLSTGESEMKKCPKGRPRGLYQVFKCEKGTGDGNRLNLRTQEFGPC
jgi:hypothetical protein